MHRGLSPAVCAGQGHTMVGRRGRGNSRGLWATAAAFAVSVGRSFGTGTEWDLGDLYFDGIRFYSILHKIYCIQSIPESSRAELAHGDSEQTHNAFFFAKISRKFH